jgi:microcystin-dependent protein
MAEAMIGEIRAFPYSYAPQGWFECDGRQLAIRNYAALYATIGLIYGGDGTNTFNLPNLQGRVAAGAGQGSGLSFYQLGKATGAEGIALTNPAQLPSHSHRLQVQFLALGQEAQDFTASPKAGESYACRYWFNLSQRPAVSYVMYNPTPPASGSAAPVSPVMMATGVLDPLVGTSQPHENRQPYLPLRFCICWDGYFAPNPG